MGQIRVGGFLKDTKANAYRQDNLSQSRYHRFGEAAAGCEVNIQPTKMSYSGG